MDEAGDKAKTKAQLIEELQALRQQLAESRGREETGREQMEESPLRERDMLRILMENVPDWIFFKDAESRLLRSNRSHAQLLGFDDPQEVVGKTDFDFFPPEEAQRFFDEEQAMLQAAQPVVARLGQTSGRDGEVRWVSETKIPLKDETGKVIGLVGLSRNVTELKRAEEALKKAHAEVEKQVEERTAELMQEIAERKRVEEALRENEERFRLLIETMNVGLSAIDEKGIIIYANERLSEMWGYPMDEIIGRSTLDFLDEENLKIVKEQLAKRRKGEYGSYEITWTRKDGQKIHTILTPTPHFDADGRYKGSYGFITDITEPKQAEEALERRAVKLQAAAEVSRAAGSHLDLDVLIQQVVGLVRERFDLYYAGLFLLDEPGEWAILRAGTGEAGQQMIAQGHKLEVGGTSMIGACVADKHARIALDVGEEAARFENPFLPQTRSELALPLITRDEAIGALTIQSTEEAAFGDEDIAVFQIMADQLANAITNARLFVQTQAALTEMERIQRQYTEQAWGEYAHMQGVLGYEQTAEGVMPLGGEVLPEVERALEELDTVVLDGEDGASVLIVPVLLRGHPLGALGFRLDGGAESVSRDDIALAESVGEQFALAAENLRLLDETQRRAARERLTRDITDKMRRAVSIEGVVQAAVDELFDALGTSRAFVRLGIGSDGDGKD